MCFWKSLKGLHYFIDSQSNLDQEEPLGSFSPTPYWKQVPLAQDAQDFFSWVLNTLFSQILNIPKKADIHISLCGQNILLLNHSHCDFFLLCPNEIGLDATSDHCLVVFWHVSAWLCLLYNHRSCIQLSV